MPSGMYSTVRFHMFREAESHHVDATMRDRYRGYRKWRTVTRVTGRRAGQEFWGEEARGTAAGRQGEEGEVRKVDTRYMA